MGRKIPGKKHHGVKDPLEQQARRDESLKLKLNAPPVNPDEQEIPRSILELKRLRDMVKEGKFDVKKKHKKKNKLLDTHRLAGYDPKLPGMKRPDKTLPKLVQMPHESDERFIQRVNEVTEDIINEVKYEKQYNVNVERNQFGKVESVQNDVELSDRSKKKNKKVQKKKLATVEQVTIKRSLNRKQRLNLKKAAREEEGVKDFSNFCDKVKFGEVAHQPPHLSVRPKGTNNITSRPGCKSLLLKGIFNSSVKKGDKPAISMATKQKLEAQRVEAVAAYRTIKAAKWARQKT